MAEVSELQEVRELLKTASHESVIEVLRILREAAARREADEGGARV